MVQLINKYDIAEYKPISKGRDVDALARFIVEAQDLDLKELLCDSFFYDLLKNRQLPAYQKLIHGETYTKSAGATATEITFKGLKPVLVYFFWSRYAMDGDVIDTPVGQVQKTIDNSTVLSQSAKRDMRDTSIQTAMSYFKEVAKYLDQKIDVFPKWKECSNCGCGDSKIAHRKFRTSTL